MTLKERLQKIASWFQPAYNNVEKWDCPLIRDLCREVWPLLDDSIKKALWDFIKALIEKYGEKEAYNIVSGIVKAL